MGGGEGLHGLLTGGMTPVALARPSLEEVMVPVAKAHFDLTGKLPRCCLLVFVGRKV